MTKRKSGNHTYDLESLRKSLASATGPYYWKSLSELAETESFQDYLTHEFPALAETLSDSVSRRRFLQVMGASLALAGLTQCTRQPEERIVPYVRAPEELIPGKALFYASAVPFFGYAQGVLVESNDGRPTKIEGNPLHPASLGATTVHTQASILDLYDPDRLNVITFGGRVRTWETFVAAMTSEMERFRLSRGEGLRILTGNITSPSISGQLSQLLEALPEAQRHQYEAINVDTSRKGAELAFGRSVNTYYQLDRASVILSLDSDFLFWGPGSVRYAKDFSAARRIQGPQSNPNRLYAVESSPTVSSTQADHRLTVKHREVEEVARSLARALGLPVPGRERLTEEQLSWVSAAARDLLENRGRSVVLPGDYHSAVVHGLAHLINEALGSSGAVVVHTDPIEAEPVLHGDSLASLVEAMKAGAVETLLILGGNPVFDAPADLRFAEALERVRLKVHLSTHENETSRLCNWQIPESHVLESWGDLRAFEGTTTLVQPLIEPLYRSKSALELLAAINGQGSNGYELVRDYWRQSLQTEDFERGWRRALHDGVLPETRLPALQLSVNREVILADAGKSGAEASGYEVIFRPDPHIYDGRFINNGWLQEAPKPLTKLTWDNAAILAPSLAADLHLAQGQVVELKVGESAVKAPVWIQPGHPAGAVTLHLGYGRRVAGQVGSGAGIDPYPLRRRDGLWSASGVEITGTAESRPLACTQDHYSMEGRHLVREATLEAFRQDPELIQNLSHEPSSESALYPGFDYEGYAWGMAVDLNACIGCNACVVACQSENNIPVIGREEVSKGREMHWIRVDRYYSGSLDNPGVLHQPVMCQHCENAPCETVCPVAATVHSQEGLNDMVYNRCVGTRYCSNNCPYKVRRFNFLLYSDWQTDTLKMGRNPNVTVRSRGVMEKCTYCVQRINAAKIQAKLEDRSVRDGEISTACQQVCPTEAIVFGDQNEPSSRVSELKRNQRNYGILTELNTKPRTTYLGRIHNPNPDVKERIV